jgi:hypothetical protein
MAATNFTPIQLYFSTTASAVPLAANLAQGELAINITDGKLYYEDNAGVVQVIATKGAGTIGGSNTQIQYNNNGALAGNAAMTFNSATSTTTLTTLNLTNALGATFGGTAQSSYTQGDILYSSATNTLAKLGIGTVNFILTSTGSVPQWVAPTSITVQTANNLAGGAAGSVPYQSAIDTTTFLAIGATNRVMTSTGSAPQWVTALTGLTGVSSSSITNTSLTSGRVVLSTTAGLQADSANLTFNGTTLSATGFSTTGLSTLVQTVTIGNSNFSGTAVFAPTTPAKLYIGTGTVTDTTSAIGATNATGAISSLAITPIAATNTSVTYTNASTLYIAGAPSAGTNITITNPYSLYVAAGTSYFGGAVNFATTPIYSGGTANGVMYLDGSKNITTGTALVFNGANLGLGVTPSAWDAISYTAMQFPNGGTLAGYKGSVVPIFNLTSNGYYDSGDKYVVTGAATQYSQDQGVHKWKVAASGTAGNAISFTQAMTLNANGQLGVGVTSPGTIIDAQDGLGSTRITLTNTANAAAGAGVNFLVKNGVTTVANATVRVSNVNTIEFFIGADRRVAFDSGGRVGFGTSGTTADRLVDMAFAGATLNAGANQFGLVLNPTYPNTATSSLFNMYAGPNISTGATITAVYNLYLEAINSVGSTVTNKWGVYQAGASDNNYFAGNVQVNNGITFPATQVASAGANTLDDYEEGTWTPTLDGWTGTYTSQVARYTKIGRVVNVSGVCVTTAGSGTFGPFLQVSSFPFVGLTASTGSARAGFFTVLTGIGVSMPVTVVSAGPMDGPSNNGVTAFCNVWKTGANSDNFSPTWLDTATAITVSFTATYVTTT